MNVIDELKLLADAKTSIYGSICVAQAAIDALEQAQVEIEASKEVRLAMARHSSRQGQRIEQLEAALQDICAIPDLDHAKYAKLIADQTLAPPATAADSRQPLTCCRMHAGPIASMSMMFICSECGDKRCAKAERCGAPCTNDGVHPDDKSTADSGRERDDG